MKSEILCFRLSLVTKAFLHTYGLIICIVLIYFTLIHYTGPGGVQAPNVEILSATSVEITWAPPIQPNGELESYIIRLPIPRIEIRNVSINNLLLENLAPFTEYRVTVTACTGRECSFVVFRTTLFEYMRSYSVVLLFMLPRI